VTVLLSASDLSLMRGNALLFSGVSLTASAGEAWVVRGANGCGKTSLLRLLSGITQLTQAESGTVVRNSALLYVGHANALKDDLTVDENLDFALRADGLYIDIHTRAQALLHVGLHTKRALQAKRLSQGQKRRVGLARLWLAPQKIWLLDEPTNALDDEVLALFETVIGGHLQTGGTAIIATHLPLNLAQYAMAVHTLALGSLENSAMKSVSSVTSTLAA
jgi:heme exporter protein A